RCKLRCTYQGMVESGLAVRPSCDWVCDSVSGTDPSTASTPSTWAGTLESLLLPAGRAGGGASSAVADGLGSAEDIHSTSRGCSCSGGAAAVDAGVVCSKPPRISGSPPSPAPMTTTLLLGEVASSTVALMPFHLSN